MIVNYTPEGWEIVTQRAHGLLAAQIALQWKKTFRGDRWPETLLAIAEHDDARVKLDRGDLLTPQGAPVDFKMQGFEEQHCLRTMDLALSKSRYIGLLCSMHLTFVYERFKNSDRKAQKFISDQQLLQRQLYKDIGIKQREAQKDYRLLEWCDALSLLLCQRLEQPCARTVEISRGPDDHNHKLCEHEDGKLTVISWPFEEDRFVLHIEGRMISTLAFKDAAAFRKAFCAANVHTFNWIFERTI